MQTSAQQIISRFRQFDDNGDGTISRDELAAVMGKVGDISPRSLDRVLVEMDTNGDGKVSYEEFVAWCCPDASPVNADLPSPLFTYADAQVVDSWNVALGAKFQLTSGFSFAGWVYLRGWTADYDRVFDFGTASIPSARLHRNGDSTLHLAFNQWDLCDFEDFWPDVGQWVHIAVSVTSEGSCTAYRDGALFQMAALKAAPLAWSNWQGDPDSDMAVRKLGWYNTALTAEHVLLLAADGPDQWEQQKVRALILDSAAHCLPQLQAFSQQELMPHLFEGYRHRRTRVDETHRRAMTLAQLLDLGKFLSKHPTFSVGRITWLNVNLYLLCDLFVIPPTSPCRCSFMELVADGPVVVYESLVGYTFPRHTDNAELPQLYARFANNQHDLSELKQIDLFCDGNGQDCHSLSPYLVYSGKFGWGKLGENVPACLMDDGSGHLVGEVGDERLGLQFPPEVALAGVRTDIYTADASNQSDKHDILRHIAGGALSSEEAPPSSHPGYDKVNLAIRCIFGPRALMGAAL
ncbi:unnamed protein product [Polarella glacialis]|uniref:EF-hand domain-containing protein n=1 Tax=Polarella glacialis TaxID=89957 RepID=A0A813DHU0_POLGL|nr:unnamed protein product [Polarella glacialis]